MSLIGTIQELGDMVTYYPRLKGIAKTTNNALLLCRLMLWDGKQSRGAGSWIYKTIEEMKKETGLTRYEQDTCRRQLIEMGYIEVSKKGVPAKTHYKLNNSKIESDWRKFVEKSKEESQFAVDQQTSLQQTHKLVCSGTTDKFAEEPQTITKRQQRDFKETYIFPADSDESEKVENEVCRESDSESPTDFKKSKLKIETKTLTNESKDDTISPSNSLLGLVGKGKAEEKKKEISELHLSKYLNTIRNTKNEATLKTNIRKVFTAMCSIEGYPIGGRAGVTLGGLPHATVNSALTFSKEEGREAFLELLAYSVGQWPKVKSKVNAQTKDEKYKAGDSPSLAIIMNRYPLILEMRDSRDTVKQIAKTADISEIMGKKKEKKVEVEYIPEEYEGLIRNE